MKNISVLIFWLIFQNLNAQTEIKYDKVKEDLFSSSEILIVSIYSHNLEKSNRPYFIDLQTEFNTDSPELFYDKTKTQLTFTLITNKSQRNSILKYLESNGYLDKLYVRINETYMNISETKDTFSAAKPVFLVELFHLYHKEYFQTYFPILTKEKGRQLLNDLSLFFEHKERGCFMKMINEIE